MPLYSRGDLTIHTHGRGEGNRGERRKKREERRMGEERERRERREKEGRKKRLRFWLWSKFKVSNSWLLDLKICI